jgi:uncharacterized protein YndB with AHSA1/START domain
MTAESPVIARASRRLAAAPERVFDAWLDPALLARWMFPGDEPVRFDLDPRVGGAFSFVVRREGGDLEHAGRFLVLDRPRRLAFTWAIPAESPDEDVVTVEIAADGAGSLVTVSHELAPAWAAYEGYTVAAWDAMLAALARELAGPGDRLAG